MNRIIDIIANRPTIILKKPILSSLLKHTKLQLLVEEESMPFFIVKEKWGKKLASGVVDKMLAELERKGHKVSPELRDALIDAWASVVTKGLLE